MSSPMTSVAAGHVVAEGRVAAQVRPAARPASRASRRLLSLAVAAMTTAVLAACSDGSSGSSASAPTTPASASTTPAGSPTASGRETTKPAKALDLRPTVGTAPHPKVVTGFAYAAPSRGALRAAATAGNQYTQLSSGRVVRGVTKNGRRIGDVAVFGLHPRYASSALLQEQLVHAVLTGLAGPGAKSSAMTFGMTRTQVATTSASYAVGWYEPGAILVVVGSAANRAGVQDFVAAFPRLG